MHVHSTASQYSKLGVQRSLGLPECATPPEQVYELAKRRGMDFVTITDHDTIAGGLELDHLDDTFLSEELTVVVPRRATGRARAVLRDHTRPTTSGSRPTTTTSRSARRTSTSTTSTCALAHPFYAVEAPLTPRHRRRLAELFPIWETRNGSRAKELNLPAFIYIETHGGTGIGGTDDHAGVDIGRTYTQTPSAVDAGRLPCPRAGRPGERARRAGQRGEVGARGDGPGDPVDRPGRERGGQRSGGGPRDRRASAAGGRRPPRDGHRRPRSRRRPRPAAGLAGGRRARRRPTSTSCSR